MKATWIQRILVLALFCLALSVTGNFIGVYLPDFPTWARPLTAVCSLIGVLVTAWAAWRMAQETRRLGLVLEELAHTAETSFYTLDRQGRLGDIIESDCDHSPWPAIPRRGCGLDELFDHDFADSLKNAISQTTSDGRGRRVRHSLEIGGQFHSFETRIRRFDRSSGGGKQVALAIRDISRNALFERHQANSVRWFRTLFNKLSEAVVLSDSSGSIRGLNHRTMELYGWRKHELLDHPLSMLFVNGTNETTPLATSDLENPVRVSEHYHVHRDGEVFPVEIRNSPIRIDGQDYTLSLIRDISFQKELEEQQRLFDRNLLEQNAMRDKLFSILAHDLRGPVGNLRSFLAMYHQDHHLFSQKDFDEFLEGLWKSSDATWALLENLLAWVRNQFDDISINQRPLGLIETCRLVVSWLAPQAQAKQQEIQVLSTVDHVVFTDHNMLQTVIRNLLGNAIKFSPIGGMIKLRAVSAETEVGIVVEDSGPGIAPERQGELFTLRGGGSSPGTAGEKGSGLGLVLCKEIIERLGGRITAANSANGAIFTIWLPAGVEGELDLADEDHDVEEQSAPVN